MSWTLSAVAVASVLIHGGTPTTAPARPRMIRKPALAGRWYPAEAPALARQVDRLLANATAQPLPPGRPVFLVQPHAGYVFSGRAAATGLKSITRDTYDRIVILGPSHDATFSGASIPDVTHYATPLGDVPLDLGVCTALLGREEIATVPTAHIRERSIEAQLPLLQWAFGVHPAADRFEKTDRVAVPFKMVPVVFGNCTPEQLEAIARALEPHVTPRTLVLVSSDLTHYGADFKFVPFKADIKRNLATLDGEAVKHILAKDRGAFVKYLEQRELNVCGRAPIEVMMRLLPAKAVGKQIIYYSTGDVTGIWSHTVGYTSLVFCVPE